MQYMLMIAEDESIYAGDEGARVMEKVLAGHMAFAEALVAKGVAFSGNRLKPADTATTIKWSGGEHSLHDGPYAETHEELGGYYVIEAANLDEAIEWAKMIPVPGTGSVEVRPIWPEEG